MNNLKFIVRVELGDLVKIRAGRFENERGIGRVELVSGSLKKGRYFLNRLLYSSYTK